MELYLHVKAMVAQTLEKCMANQNEIMHTIQIFQGKFKLMCHLAYGIKFKVLKTSNQSWLIKPCAKGLASVGTRGYPITMDKDSRPIENQVADEEDEVQLKGERAKNRPLLRIDTSQP